MNFAQMAEFLTEQIKEENEEDPSAKISNTCQSLVDYLKEMAKVISKAIDGLQENLEELIQARKTRSFKVLFENINEAQLEENIDSAIAAIVKTKETNSRRT